METELPKKRKKQTAQEVFKDLREKTKAEMLEKKQKIKDAQDKAVAAKANKEKKKKGKGEEITDVPKRKESLITIKEKPSAFAKEKKVEIQETSERQPPKMESSHNKLILKPDNIGDSHRIKAEPVKKYHRYRKRQGKCTNCCGGLPGQGPGTPLGRIVGQSCCSSANRLRGGSDESQFFQGHLSNKLKSRSSSVPSGKSELSRSLRNVRKLDNTSTKSVEFVKDSRVDSFSICSDERCRGGCGGCGGSPKPATARFQRSQVDQYQRDCGKLINHRFSLNPPVCCQPSSPPVCQREQDPYAKISSTMRTKGCCPCGGCGGAACSDNPGGGEVDGGCCGGSRLRGLPCKCKCQSCSSSTPHGGCGGQSCGRIYSCAGSGGGKCCFPRNYKRRSGPDCCGGADPNCGGCC